MPPWFPVVITIALFVVGIYNAAIGYFLKQHMQRVDGLEKKQDDMQRELHEFKQQVPALYIRQDDYVRFQTALDHKLDKVYDAVVDLKIGSSRQQEIVAELKQKVAAAEQTAAAAHEKAVAAQMAVADGHTG